MTDEERMAALSSLPEGDAAIRAADGYQDMWLSCAARQMVRERDPLPPPPPPDPGEPPQGDSSGDAAVAGEVLVAIAAGGPDPQLADAALSIEWGQRPAWAPYAGRWQRAADAVAFKPWDDADVKVLLAHVYAALGGKVER